MKVMKEETFGPLAPLFRFHDEAEGIAMANDTGVRSWPPISTAATSAASGGSARGWNTASSASTPGIISTEVAPFGGFKESGLGREGSKYGIEEFLEIKYMCLGDIDR